MRLDELLVESMVLMEPSGFVRTISGRCFERQFYTRDQVRLGDKVWWSSNDVLLGKPGITVDDIFAWDADVSRFFCGSRT